jgi:FtsP/CotA-like multicopper oxidase with cupredoxin domain
MNRKITPRLLSRRNFLKLGGGSALAMALGGSALYNLAKTSPSLAAPALPATSAEAGLQPPARPNNQATSVNIRLAATDGFFSFPGRRIGINYNDFNPLEDEHNGVFGFGFIRVPLSVSPSLAEDIGAAILAFKGRVQWPSPILSVNQDDQVNVTMTNLGFLMRPDLDDSHTIHWHGFRNPNAIFDGVPEVSIAVPPARSFTYFYLPRNPGPGSYPYHCHFEDTEHVQLGMDGVVFVNPRQDNGDVWLNRAYHHPQTEFDRQYTLLLNEIDTTPHDQLVNIQEFVWSDYDANYWIINGRSYPDTILSDSEIVGTELEFRQPISSLIQALPGEQILLRFVNIGFEQQTMQLLGIRMRVVGQDAVSMIPLGLAYEMNTLYIGPGESRDVIFTAPDPDPALPVASDAAGDYQVYWLKNHSVHRLRNGSRDRVNDPEEGNVEDPFALDGVTPAELGGQITQVRVYVGNLNADFGEPQDYANQTVPKVI